MKNSKARKRIVAKKSRTRKEKKTPSKSTNATQLRDAFSWLVGDSLVDLKKHGNADWNAFYFAVLAVLWALSKELAVTKAFVDAYQQSMSLFGSSAFSSYQGMMKALCSNGHEMRVAIIRGLHSKIRDVMGEEFKIHQWVPFAIDGTTSRPPQTVSNERAFVSPNYGNNKSAKHRKKKKKPKSVKAPVPRVLLAMIWHMTARLPWAWKLGRAGVGERTLVRQMFDEEQFPKNSLFVGDAGFVGYDLWKKMSDLGHYFLIRVGNNISFLQDQKSVVEQDGNLVYYWPTKQYRKRCEPLVLRLLYVTIGNKEVALVTNVLEPSLLDKKLAKRFYKMRWGIELEFRSLKQVFQRRKLHCKEADRCEQELDWSVLAMCAVDGYSLMQRMSKKAKSKSKKSSKSKSLQIGFVQNLDAFRTSLTNLNNPRSKPSLNELLLAAVPDNYKRKSTKQGRHRPSGKSRKPTGLPITTVMNDEQRLKLQQIQLAIAC